MNMNPDDFELLQQYIDGSVSESAIPRLRDLLRDSAQARATLRTLATLDFGLEEIAAGQSPMVTRADAASMEPLTTSRIPTMVKALLALAGLLIAGLGFALFWQLDRSSSLPQYERDVATITGIGGEIVWTGNGGTVSNDLKIGSHLTGGTIEGASPTSWVELEFLDGSRVTVAGDSRLTFSDFGQKVLHLKEGNLTSSVEPQVESPMLVHTRNAMLEVLGTEFDVRAEFDATSLNVTEGKVRLKRLSDGQTVEVPAQQRVTAAEGFALEPQPIPELASQWKSGLHQPTALVGRWLPKTDSAPPRLQLVHYLHVPPVGDPLRVMLCAMAVSGKDNEQVQLHSDSKILVRGYTRRSQQVVFGVSVRDVSGGFGGVFISYKPNEYWMQLGQLVQQDSPIANNNGLLPFEVELDSSDFLLSTELESVEDKFPTNPIGLMVDGFFCTTPSEDTGIEITEVKIFRATSD